MLAVAPREVQSVLMFKCEKEEFASKNKLLNHSFQDLEYIPVI